MPYNRKPSLYGAAFAFLGLNAQKEPKYGKQVLTDGVCAIKTRFTNLEGP